MSSSYSRSHRNSKLESFLQRILSEEEYSRIRAYASCVVQSSFEHLTFRRAVLTDDTIYLTEYPPKSLYIATKIPDVLSASVVNDDPWFLSGDERENCQHLLLICKIPSSIVRRSWRSGRLSVSEREFQPRINAQASPKIWRRIVKSLQGSSPRRNSVGTYSNSEDTLTEEEETSPHHESNGDSINLPTCIKSDVEHDNDKDSNPSQYWNQSPFLSPTITSVSSQDSGISETDPFDDLKSLSTFSSLETWPKATAQRFLQLKSQSAMDYYTSSRDELTPLPERSKSTSDAVLVSKKPIEIKEFPKSLSFEKEPQKTHLINLYILEPHSGFISNFFLVRDNYLIRSTLLVESDIVDHHHKKHIKSEIIEKLLNDLKEELTASLNDIEKTFHLLQELKTAAKKYFILRLLFWKDSSLPKLLIYFLKHYFSHLQDIGNGEDCLSECEDELHLSVLILETLNVMFRETEVSASRQQYLTSNKNKAFENILNIIVAGPTIPKQYLNMTNHMLTSFDDFKSKAWMNLPEAEIIKLLVEVTTNRMSILFEIIFSCQQVDIAEKFSVNDVCNVISKNPFAETFISEIMTQCLSLLMPDHQQTLHAKDIVHLYQYLYVLKAIVSSNSTLEIIICEKFGEEFRYYIHPNLVASSIQDVFPLKEVVIKLLQELSSKLKEKHISKSSWHQISN